MTFERYCIIDGSRFETDDPDESLCPYCRGHREVLSGKTTISEENTTNDEGVILVNGELIRRVPFGEEPERGIPAFDIADYNFTQCPECGVRRGEYHKKMCAHEICPCCGKMLITCDCLIGNLTNQMQKDVSTVPAFPEPDLTTIEDLGGNVRETGQETPQKQFKPQPPCEWKTGQIIMDDYEVRQKIGAGGFCEVYQVHARKNGHEYAVKFPKSFCQQGVLRTHMEIECMFRLQGQQNILQIHRAHLWQGIPLIFTELLEGGNLANWIRGEKFDLYQGNQEQVYKRILRIILETAEALSNVHARNIVHLNIKPNIILLRPNGSVTLGGLGVARILKESQQSVTSNAYTPAYCSPEQAKRSDLTHKSDIWSWAVSVLEMFSGGVFWMSGQIADSAFESYLKRDYDAHIPLMPSKLVILLRECFRRDPKDRPKGMDWIVRFLQELYQEEFGELYLIAEFPLPLSANAWQKEGLWQFELGHFTQAEQLFRKVCTYYPENGWGWLNLLFVLLNQSKDPAEAIQAIIEPPKCEYHQRISIGQVALQLSSITKIQIDRLNRVVWVNGEIENEPMGDFCFAPYSFRGRNLNPAQLANAYPKKTLKRKGYTVHHPWMVKLDHQEKVGSESETVLETIMVENDLSIKCATCGIDVTKFANSDGRANELFGLVEYTCPNCVNEKLALTLEDFGDYRLIQNQEGRHKEQLSRSIKLAGGQEMELWYHARHTKTCRIVSLLLQPKHLRKEFQIKYNQGQTPPLLTLNHPNLILPFESSEFAGMVYEVYEKNQGQELRNYVSDQGGKLPLDQSIIIIKQVFDGVEYLHQKGLVHRDICSRNIRIKEDQGVVNARLTEWMFLASSQSRLALDDIGERIYFGTLPFMAPEKIPDSRTANQPTVDTYSLGAVLYFMLTGYYPQPFPCQNEQKNEPTLDPIRIILDKDPIPIAQRVPNLPDPVARVVDKAVRKDPKERYQTARSFRQALISAMESLQADTQTLVDDFHSIDIKTISDNQLDIGYPKITCALCGKDITTQANSDGRAADLGDEITYWCKDCSWQKFPFQAYYGDEWGYIHYPVCWHAPTGRAVTMKTVRFLHDREKNKFRLQNDLAKLAEIVHPHITRIIDVLTTKESITIVSAYYPGLNLQAFMQKLGEKKLTTHKAGQIILGLLNGLDQIHQRYLVYNNLNLENVLFADGDILKPKLCLAEFNPFYFAYGGDPESDWPHGRNLWPFIFICPEWLTNFRFPQPRWDLFSLGQLLYYLLTGKVSFDYTEDIGDSDGSILIRKLITYEPIPIAERDDRIPEPIANIVDQAVNKDTNKRFQKVAEFRTSLVKALKVL